MVMFDMVGRFAAVILGKLSKSSLVKTDLNWLFKTFALSMAEVTVLPTGRYSKYFPSFSLNKTPKTFWIFTNVISD